MTQEQRDRMRDVLVNSYQETRRGVLRLSDEELLDAFIAFTECLQEEADEANHERTEEE